MKLDRASRQSAKTTSSAGRARGFEPVADARATVLLLGSFPSQASLSAGHYYAHPQNQFWRLISSVLARDLTGLDWAARYKQLRAHRIALWDVIDSCERPGSLDADIREAQANDLDALLARLPRLRRVLFNGATAARAAQRFADAGFEVRVLPSSSPANARMRFEEKLEAWREAFDRAPVADVSNVPITLSEEGGIRYLHFGSPWIQGAMLVDRPSVLVLDYVQRMMAWLLFLSPPPRILQLGLGAGGLTRFAHAEFPQSGVTVVEASPDVIEVARSCFALPAESPRLRIRCEDAARFVARQEERGRYGIIQVDLYDQDARGPTVDTEAFYRDCRRALAAPGICVVNLFGSHRSFAPNVDRLAAAFAGRVLVMPPTPAGNRIALAFAGPALTVDWGMLAERAIWLERRYGWLVTQWAEMFRRDAGGAVCAV